MAAHGIPVMRFDYRGMGDADGAARDFAAVDSDIGAAIDAFFARQPDLREVVLWGLCDAASAALFYGWRDPRVTGMVLLNPWVRTEAGQARAYVRHYYSQRLLTGEFWRKLISGRFDWRSSVKGFWGQLKRMRSRNSRSKSEDRLETLPLPERMAEGLARFKGKVLFILSGQDLTADEFRDTVSASARWRELMQDSSIVREDLPEADHTFSRRQWRDDVAKRTWQWVESI
jgi:exosortase A-associated hydrolase 1